MRENEVTIGRMEVRIGLLRKEVEGRGMRWGECEGEEKVADDEVVEGGVANGGDGAVVEERMEGRREESRGAGERNGRGTGGSLNDEELARRLREQMGEEEDGDESGVHL